jgi:lysophospholipase L1-like esterase
MRLVLVLLTGVLAALVIACGSGEDNEGSSTRTATPTSAEPEATRTAAPRTRTPTSTPAAAATPSPDAPLYIALGNSLSAGVGATDREATAFVPLVHQALGPGVALMNLGHSGDDSEELIEHGHLHTAIAEIGKRNGDTNPNNDVVLVTLEIGGNDLLDLYFDLVVPGTCPNVPEGLKKPVCVEALRDTLDAFTPNLRDTLQRLRQADSDLRIVLMTLYNPFSGSTVTAFEPIGELALEGLPDTPFPEGLNDLVRAEAATAQVIVADLYPLFVGKGREYIAPDLIHPNDTGYRVIADTVRATIGL